MQLNVLILIKISGPADSCHAIQAGQCGCRAGLRTMMVTGDFQHTAIAVARGVGMIPMEGQVIVIQAKSEELALQSLASLPPLQLPYSPGALAVQPQPWSPRAGGRCQALSFMLDCGGACEQIDPQEAMTRLAQVLPHALHYTILLQLHVTLIYWICSMLLLDPQVHDTHLTILHFLPSYRSQNIDNYISTAQQCCSKAAVHTAMHNNQLEVWSWHCSNNCS